MASKPYFSGLSEQKYDFGEKQDFAVHFEQEYFQTEPKVPSKPPCSKVPTIIWNLVFFFDF